MTEAERIINTLRGTTRHLSSRGYGVAQLVFADGSFVSTTDWEPDPLTEVQALLQQGEEPLGFIAPLREQFGAPFVRTWWNGDERARVELRLLASSLYKHRMCEDTSIRKADQKGEE